MGGHGLGSSTQNREKWQTSVPAAVNFLIPLSVEEFLD